MERKYLGMSLNELNETPLEEAQRKWGEVTERVRSSSAAWQAMLATAARNHKYSFRDQLMIHEYRPHATACAEHDFWEQRFHRRVHKGLKGIRLLSEDGRDVRNVFDVGDTWPFYGHEHDLPPYLSDSARLSRWTVHCRNRFGPSPNDLQKWPGRCTI